MVTFLLLLKMSEMASNTKKAATNRLAAEQCGCITAADGLRVCKRSTTAKETTGKTRTAAAGGAFYAINS
jgi:hypothetical protein